MIKSSSKSGVARRVKKHVVAKEHAFLAIVQPGFEKTSAEELKNIGIKNSLTLIDGGVEFSGRLEECYRVNLLSRTVNRVVMRVTKFKSTNFLHLKKKLENIPWEIYIKDERDIQFTIKCMKSRLYHTGKIEEVFKDAITSRLKSYDLSSKFSQNQSRSLPQLILVRFSSDICQISIDTSGDLLYKRGDKINVTSASLRETLAAQILLTANAHRYNCLVDPFCGSGTFSLEALGIFDRNVPGIKRNFSFQLWPSYSEGAFNFLKKSIQQKIGSEGEKEKKTIHISDIAPESVETAGKNFAELNVDFVPRQRDFFKDILEIPENMTSLIVLNPPYGKRLKGDSEKIYHNIGITIRNNYSKCGFAIIVPGIELEKKLSLKYDRKILFMNGGIKVSLLIKDSY